MKKWLLIAPLIAVFAVYIIYQRGTSAPAPAAPASAPSPAQPVAPPPAASPPPQPPAVAKGAYKDGSYTGSIADAFYGPLQVKVVIKGGKLTDVEFLQYPNDRQTSIRISNESMPRLKSEAIQAQSAQVDVVSGATQTSDAFRESLASALSQASG